MKGIADLLANEYGTGYEESLPLNRTFSFFGDTPNISLSTVDPNVRMKHSALYLRAIMMVSPYTQLRN